MLAAAVAMTAVTAAVYGAATTAAPEWAMNATVIEACSCPMFCQCYFNSEPAGHGAHEGHGGGHFCKANNAYKINKGHYGAVSLDSAKFWFSGDLGADFSKGEMDWAVLTFDRAVTPPQREGIQAILGYLFPVKWKSFKVTEADIDKWEYTKDEAHALLDGGKSGEVKLKRFPGMTNEPIVIKNLPYWGAARHDGFVLMPNEVEAYRVGDKPFEFKGTNGFMLTFEITSKDVQQVAAAK
jgi:hypothetical protein